MKEVFYSALTLEDHPKNRERGCLQSLSKCYLIGMWRFFHDLHVFKQHYGVVVLDRFNGSLEIPSFRYIGLKMTAYIARWWLVADLIYH